MHTKTKLASLVAQQFPDFVREDYQKFISFVEAYYNFLDENYNVDAYAIRDIDTTLDDFVKYFKKELSALFPATRVDERFLISNVRDAYLAKGSESSFRLLMRLLFNKEVDIHYPSTQMLRASDGKWNQEYSIFVKVIRGNAFSLAGKTIKIKTIDKVIDVIVTKVSQVEIEESGVKTVSQDLAEIFVNRQFFGTFSANDMVYYGDSFESYVINTTTKIDISQSGEGFRVGEIYELKNGSGVNSSIKIERVNDVGGILRATLISYGAGYDVPFSMTLISNKTQAESRNTPEFSFTEPNVNFKEYYAGFVEQGEVVSSTYNIDPVDPLPAITSSYVGTILSQFYNSNQQTVSDPKVPAIINVDVGSIAKYPGYWTSDDGFLNSSMNIQDSYYYQAYSYVLKIDEQLEKYKSAVKTLVHPAGMALFGEYEITNVIDASSSVKSMLEILYIMLQDMAVMEDLGNIKDLVKYVGNSLLFDGEIQDNNDVLVTNFNSQDYASSTYFEVTSGAGLYVSMETELDYILKSVVKQVSDAFSVSHTRSEYAISDYAVEGYFQHTSGVDAYTATPVLVYIGNTYVEESYLENNDNIEAYVSDFNDLSQSLILSVTKNINEPVGVLDTPPEFTVNKQLSDSVGTSGNYGDNTYAENSYFTLNNGVNAYVTDLMYNETEIVFGKNVVDSFVVQETPVVVLTRGVTDQLTITESNTTSIQKNINDAIAVSDSLQLLEQNSVTTSDSALIQELPTVSLSKTIQDSFTLSDSISIVTDLERQLIDSNSFTDNINNIDSVKQLSDSATVTEELSLIISQYREFSDSINAADTIQITEANYLENNDPANVQDSSSTSLTKYTSDAVSTTESGYIWVNAYGDPTYFAHDTGYYMDNTSTLQ